MAGPAKKRAEREKRKGSSEEHASGESSQRESTQRSSPQSIGRFDGNRDPSGTSDPISYSNANPMSRNPNTSAVIADPRRLDLGMGGWAVARGYDIPSELPKRPGTNRQGREVQIGLNTFNVINFPSKPVYQYDVLIGNGAEKRGLIQKIWNSKTVREQLGNHNWLFDGNKLAWSLVRKEKEVRITVDLDQEAGRQSKKNSDRNTHRIYLKCSNTVRFNALVAFLNGTGPFDNACLEAITFMDHLMRQTPSQKYTQIKKSFFARGQGRTLLGGGIEAFKGVFSSIRAVHSLDKVGKPKPCLSVNVDVANGTFWTESVIHDAAAQLCRQASVGDFARAFGQAKQRDWKKSSLYTALKRLRKVSVYVTHRGLDKPQEFVIDDILPQDPTEYRFEQEVRNEAGEVTRKTTVSIQDYFRMKYNIALKPSLPVVKMTKKIRGTNIVQPMDVCKIVGNQRYNFKLDEKQTSSMIKFAVTLPQERWGAIEHGLGMLNWANDPNLKSYGLSIDPNRATVKGRVLPAPDVGFANDKIPAKMASSGRWRIDGKKFFQANPQPLKAWGVCVIQGRGACDAPTTTNFFRSFVRVFKSHGGRFEQGCEEPVVQLGNLVRGGEMITDIWNATGNKHMRKPQLLFFIVPDKNSELYLRIKKSCDCRYGVVSQILQAGHVMKCQDQYISNVCMKVNAKLGGTTSKAISSILPKIAKTSPGMTTMCVGADVSHAAPGSEAGSMAALTMSLNLECTRYAALCNTNGHRVEIITTANIRDCLGKLIKTHWLPIVGGGKLPDRILYFRDGVSEGQYQHVLDQEVKDMKDFIREINPRATTKFTVVVASKRHHIRFFPGPGAGDRNGNPVPGTLVETGVTHPFEFDFYLCAHSAIKGTARPVHYHVLLNEASMTAEELQQMTYEHSYQYARSTTPVSQFPAVYYAHLASNRARSHENKPSVSSGKKDTQQKTATSSDKLPTEIPPLMPMKNDLRIETSMWYI